MRSRTSGNANENHSHELTGRDQLFAAVLNRYMPYAGDERSRPAAARLTPDHHIYNS